MIRRSAGGKIGPPLGLLLRPWTGSAHHRAWDARGFGGELGHTPVARDVRLVQFVDFVGRRVAACLRQPRSRRDPESRYQDVPGGGFQLRDTRGAASARRPTNRFPNEFNRQPGSSAGTCRHHEFRLSRLTVRKTRTRRRLPDRRALVQRRPPPHRRRLPASPSRAVPASRETFERLAYEGTFRGKCVNRVSARDVHVPTLWVGRQPNCQPRCSGGRRHHPRPHVALAGQRSAFA